MPSLTFKWESRAKITCCCCREQDMFCTVLYALFNRLQQQQQQQEAAVCVNIQASGNSNRLVSPMFFLPLLLLLLSVIQIVRWLLNNATAQHSRVQYIFKDDRDWAALKRANYGHVPHTFKEIQRGGTKRSSTLTLHSTIIIIIITICCIYSAVKLNL